MNYWKLKNSEKAKSEKKAGNAKTQKKMNGFYGVEIEKQVKIKLPDRQCL